MTTTPANDSAAAVIAAVFEALDPDTVRARKPTVIAGRTAFAAILDRLERVEAENGKLWAFVRSIRDKDEDSIEGYGADGLVYEWQRQAAALLAADESEAKP